MISEHVDMEMQEKGTGKDDTGKISLEMRPNIT